MIAISYLVFRALVNAIWSRIVSFNLKSQMFDYIKELRIFLMERGCEITS